MKLTSRQLKELKRDYATTSAKELAERFGCSVYSVYNTAFYHGLKKDIEFIRERARQNFTSDHPARKYWIKKSQEPPNKGKKQVEYMSAEAIERTKATRFQKGSRPPNYRPVGSERINTDGYIEIKTSEGLRGWKLKHRAIWEQHKGDISEGCNIQFKDGNPKNCAVENLYMISRAEQLKNENSYHAKYPAEIKTLIQLKGALKRQINIKEKDNGSN